MYEIPRLKASLPSHRKFADNRAGNLVSPAVAGSDFIQMEAKKLMSNALAKSSWSKYRVAEKHFKDFLSENELTCTWPIKAEETRGFVVYLTRVKGLSVSSAKEYIAGLKTLHIIQGFSTAGLEDETAKKMLDGARNMAWVESKGGPERRAMSIPLMKLLNIELSKSNWPELEKSAAWAAFTVAFQTAARMGELLPSDPNFYDPQSVLLNGDVKKKDNVYTLHLRNPKVNSRKGDFVEIFPLESVLCPVKALDVHLAALAGRGLFLEDKPVMTISSTCFLSTGRVNEILKLLLGKHVDFNVHPISCHSFRAGLPSLLQSAKDAGSVNVNAWGRWRSSAVDAYKKLSKRQRENEFEKIRPLLD